MELINLHPQKDDSGNLELDKNDLQFSRWIKEMPDLEAARKSPHLSYGSPSTKKIFLASPVGSMGTNPENDPPYPLESGLHNCHPFRSHPIANPDFIEAGKACFHQGAGKGPRFLSCLICTYPKLNRFQ